MAAVVAAAAVEAAKVAVAVLRRIFRALARSKEFDDRLESFLLPIIQPAGCAS